MSLAIIPDDLRQHFEEIGDNRFLSDLPVGYEVSVTQGDEDLAWIFTTEYGHSKIYRRVVRFYRGRGQAEEIVVKMREMGKNVPERIWSSWEGHVKG